MRTPARALVALIFGAIVWTPALPAVAEPAASGSVTPVQIGVVEELQVFGEETSVEGVRAIAISGASHDVTGLDLGGLANRARGDQTGLQLGFYNEVEGRLTGCQLGIFSSDADLSASGLQVSTIANRVGSGSGGQLAILHNQAESFTGLQMTLGVNWADDLKGLQIGLINVNRNGVLPVFPLINFGL